MVRAAAKNWEGVAIVVDSDDYAALADEMKANAGTLSRKTRFALAKRRLRTPPHTTPQLATSPRPAASSTGEPRAYPDVLTLRWTKAQDMRYGENPHQSAAFYRDEAPAGGTLSKYTQLQGKELSYNNVADADAAWECARLCRYLLRDRQARQSCGVALGDTPAAYPRLCHRSDFGVRRHHRLNRTVDAACAEAVSKQFLEVLIAPEYTADALALREEDQCAGADCALRSLYDSANAIEMKRVGGGLLVQSRRYIALIRRHSKVVTSKAPTAQQLKDMQFVWTVAQFVKSNAIVFAKDGQTIGIGAGQMSRLDSARIAKIKAEHAGLTSPARSPPATHSSRSAMVSMCSADAGAIAVIQPGGSMRDEEVINAANERGVAMVTTGVRHFATNTQEPRQSSGHRRRAQEHAAWKLAQSERVARYVIALAMPALRRALENALATTSSNDSGRWQRTKTSA